MFHSTENKSNVDCGIVFEKESVEKREKKLEDVSKMLHLDTPSHHTHMVPCVITTSCEVFYFAISRK